MKWWWHDHKEIDERLAALETAQKQQTCSHQDNIRLRYNWLTQFRWAAVCEECKRFLLIEDVIKKITPSEAEEGK